MARVMQKRATLRRKVHILRSLSASKPVRESSIVPVALLLYIHKLKLKLAALARDYCTLYATHTRLLKCATLLKDEVRVEKIKNAGWESYVVRITCEKKGGRLVSILEAFEKLGLNVMQARISCNRLFSMEAIAVASVQTERVEVEDVSRVLLQAIHEQQKEEGNN